MMRKHTKYIGGGIPMFKSNALYMLTTSMTSAQEMSKNDKAP